MKVMCATKGALKPDRHASAALDDGSRVRTLTLGSRLLTYRLKRSSRRTIGFTIDRSGLTVTAPMRLALTTIESAIGEKQRWIFSKLEAWLDRPETFPEVAADWQDGDVFPLYGEPHVLRIALGRARTPPHYDGQSKVVTLTVASDVSPARIAALLRQWLQAEAKRCFAVRLAALAPEVGVRFNVFGLSSATTRWGSCTSTGNIRLNWRLVHFTMDIIDYVVIHELSHLREMNHSPRFWAIVEGVMPDYKDARRVLKSPAPGAIPQL